MGGCQGRGIYSPNGTGLFPQFFLLTQQLKPKKFEFLAQTSLLITFYSIFKLEFFEKNQKKTIHFEIENKLTMEVNVILAQ